MFCRCGAGAKLEGRRYTCLKTEQNSTICDGIWHGREGMRGFLKTLRRANFD